MQLGHYLALAGLIAMFWNSTLGIFLISCSVGWFMGGPDKK
jgi:hypothetical protein